MSILLRTLLLTSLFLVPASALPGAQEEHGEPSHESEQPQEAPAHDAHDHEAMEMAASEMAEGVGVDERLGQKIPPDITFVDAEGRSLTLGEAITKPTLILPVYFYCAQVCTIMLANLAEAMNKVPMELGTDYDVLAISFNENEGSEVARKAKVNYTKILKADFRPESWRFLTGDQENIRAFTDAIGYGFKRTSEYFFLHPNALVAVSSDRTVIRYLYGPRFLPFDIGMALTEAEKNTPGLSIRRLLTYCFDYEPEKKTYILKSFRILAVGIVTILLIFMVFLLRKGRASPERD